MKKFISLIVFISFTLLTASCAEIDMQQLIAAGAGAAIGAGLGAAIDKKHRGRGAAIGAVAGGITGYALRSLAKDARKKAAATEATSKKPIILKNSDGSVTAYMVNQDANGCKKVMSETRDNRGKVIAVNTDSICEKS